MSANVNVKKNRYKETNVTDKRIKPRKFNWLDCVSIYTTVGIGILYLLLTCISRKMDWIGIFVIPFMFECVENLFQKKRENDLYNIECRIASDMKGLIWKDFDNNSKQKEYIIIKNTGETVIHKLCIHIVGKQNNSVIYDCDDMLFKDEEKIIEVPLEIDSIKEVWISSFLSPETRTKYFSNIIPAKDNEYIFANVRYYDGESKAIHNNYKSNTFIRLQRTFIR